MKQIEFVGGIAAELAEVLEQNNIVATCIEGNVCEISDEDYNKLQALAPAAFDGDIIVLSALEGEVVKTGCHYSDNEDGTFTVCYANCEVTVKEDDQYLYIDLNTGLGESIYPKEDWTLQNALYDQSHLYDEHK